MTLSFLEGLKVIPVLQAFSCAIFCICGMSCSPSASTELLVCSVAMIFWRLSKCCYLHIHTLELHAVCSRYTQQPALSWPGSR